MGLIDDRKAFHFFTMVSIEQKEINCPSQLSPRVPGLVQCDESEQLPYRMCQSNQCKSSEMMILLIQVQLRRRQEGLIEDLFN